MEGKELIFQIFSEFMAKVTKIEELSDVGSRLLAGFHQGLEFIRRPPINENSDLIEHIFQTNETKRLLAYVEGGCVKSHDKIESIGNLHMFQLGLYDHLSKVKCTLEELEGLVLKLTSEMLSSNEEETKFKSNVTPVEFDAEVITNSKEGMESSEYQKPEVTDYAVMMSIIFSMVKRDFDMQEKIISSLSIKSTSGELESYSLMWSLRPYINDEIMHQALRLIP